MATTPTKVTPLRSRKQASPPATNGAPPAQEVRSQDEIVYLPVEQLVPNPANPRRELGDLEELAASIRALGILEPLIIAPQAVMAERCCMVVAGHRRLAAARLAGLDWVPCILRKLSDRQALEVMLVENLHRADLAPLEEAAAYRRLVELGRTQRQLAAELGRSQGHISKRLALLELPEVARNELDAGGITLEDAQALAKLKDAPERVAAAIETGRQWGRIPQAISQQLVELEHDRARAKAIADLEAAGVKVIEPEADRFTVKGAALSSPQSYRMAPRNGHLPFTPERHQGEPCHAATLTRDGEPYWLCINPKRHDADGPSKLKIPKDRAAKETAEDRKRREEAKQRREEAKARTEFMRTWLARSQTTPERTSAEAQVLEVFLADANANPAKVACTLLGIEPIERKTSYGATEKSSQGALSAHAKDAPGRRLQAALALAFGLAEELISSEWGSWSSDKVEAHFAYLQACGYQLSPFEAEKLAAAARKEQA